MVEPGHTILPDGTSVFRILDRIVIYGAGGPEVLNDSPTAAATFARQDRPLRTFEEQMDLARIEAAIDGARERFEQAAGAKVREIAQEIAQGGKVQDAETELAGLLAAELRTLYTAGRETVAAELERQSTDSVLRNPSDASSTFAAAPPDTLTRRARLAAQTIIARIVQLVERLSLNGRHSDADLQAAAEREAAGALRAEAQVHAAPALNEGREAEAAESAALIAGARYTSLLDANRCEACAEADDDVLRPLDDPVRLAHRPPNPDCHGGGRCRCMEWFQLKDEGERVP